jgi:hypothetical protein
MKKFFFIFFFIFISTLFLNFDKIKKQVTLKYPNLRFVKYLFKSNSLVNNISNDYNIKFLPETEFVKLNLIKKKINFKDEYYNPPESKSTSYKRYGTFFIEIFKKKFILIDYLGNFYTLNNDEDFLNKALKTPKVNYLKTNLITSRVFDSLIIRDNIYVSHISKKNGCVKSNISFAKINNKELKFNFFFRSNGCHENGSPSRMQFFTHNNKNGILFSTASGSYDDPGNDAQNKDSLFGKIMFIELVSKKKHLYSYGHRVVQGLYAENNLILATEHGPKGGDEINKILFEENYGWPIASYGDKYNFKFKKKPFYKKNHYSLGFTEPLFSFVPAIGISEIIKLPNNFSIYLQDKFIVSSLNGRSIFFVNFDKNHNRVIYLEKIFLNERVRDLKYDLKNKNILLAFEENGEIGILSLD